MIYIVTGFMRSYTSMMMECLMEGGMEAAYDDTKLYELSPEKRLRFRADPSPWEGKLLKFLCNYGQMFMPFHVGTYRTVLLIRDPIDIKRSWEKMAGTAMLDENKKKISPTQWCRLYQSYMRTILMEGRVRRDVDMLPIETRALLENPVSEFTRMRDVGWPINPEKAASRIDYSRLKQVYIPEP